jgi:DNA-binding GntR family transcriptional regulator
MPVREAFRQLEAMGLIANRLHKGAVVTSLPLDQVGELFDLRALLECDLLLRAMEKATKTTDKSAAAILIQLETAYHNHDIGSWGALNWAFHKSLYSPAARIQTLATVERINLQTDRYIRLQMALLTMRSLLPNENIVNYSVSTLKEAAMPQSRIWLDTFQVLSQTS